MATKPTSNSDFVLQLLERDEKGSLKGYSREELKNQSNAIINYQPFKNYLDWSRCDPEYKDEFPYWKRAIGISIVALLIIGPLSLILSHLLNIPQNMIHWLWHASPLNLALSAGIPIVLITGACIVIYRALRGKEEMLGNPRWEMTYSQNGKKVCEIVEMAQILASMEDSNIEIDSIKKVESEEELPGRGAFSNLENHLHSTFVSYRTPRGKSTYLTAYLDTSTLDAEGNGKAYLYRTKLCFAHYYISTVVAVVGTPFYLIGTIVSNIIRAALIPFYILFQCVIEEMCGTAVNEKEPKLRLLDIPEQMAFSIIRAAKAPFYALAYQFAAFYSLFNPMGGRKLASFIELDWNRGKTLAEAWWSINGKQTLFKWRGDDADSLFNAPVFLAGCWQSFGIVEMEKGEIKIAYWSAMTVNPNLIYAPYNVKLRSDLTSKVREFSKHSQFRSIINEYHVVEKALEALDEGD